MGRRWIVGIVLAVGALGACSGDDRSGVDTTAPASTSTIVSVPEPAPTAANLAVTEEVIAANEAIWNGLGIDEYSLWFNVDCYGCVRVQQDHVAVRGGEAQESGQPIDEWLPTTVPRIFDYLRGHLLLGPDLFEVRFDSTTGVPVEVVLLVDAETNHHERTFTFRVSGLDSAIGETDGAAMMAGVPLHTDRGYAACYPGVPMGPLNTLAFRGTVVSTSVRHAHMSVADPEGSQFVVPASLEATTFTVDEIFEGRVPVGDVVTMWTPGFGSGVTVGDEWLVTMIRPADRDAWPEMVRCDTTRSDGPLTVGWERRFAARDALDELTAARALWDSLNHRDYDAVVSVACFCYWTGGVNVEVRDGVVVDLNDAPGWVPRTPDELFDRAERALRRVPDHFDLVFDDASGAPLVLDIDDDLDSIDDELRFDYEIRLLDGT